MSLDTVDYSTLVKMAEEEILEYLVYRVLDKIDCREEYTRKQAREEIETATYTVLDKIFDET